MATIIQNPAYGSGSTVFGGRLPVVSTVARALAAGVDALLVWQQRESERRHLATLSGFHLNDMGLSRADVSREIRKPFWQA